MDADTTSTLPFADLNLRRNPFGACSLLDQAALADVEVDEVVTFLDTPRATVQFTGDKGYGKTTHLLAIRERFSASGYVHIAEGERAELPAGIPLLIDEAQRLTFRQRRKLFRTEIPLVLGTHTDFTRSLERSGRQVWTLAVQDRMTPERLTRILNARIEWVRRKNGPVPRVRYQTAARMLAQFGPDVRQIQYELYLSFQNRKHGICDV
ncbi:MAG: hypothetical protein VX346_06700 [Planctomycetota bacterium]|nr:hypothetical protein [Planctomycetota bacterium]